MRSEGPETPLAVMAKPVGSRCNMRCAYCYYLDKGKYSENKKQTRMSFDLLEKLIRQTVAAFLPLGFKEIERHTEKEWTGGLLQAVEK